MRRSTVAAVFAAATLTVLGCGGAYDEPKIGNVKEDPRIQRAGRDGDIPVSAAVRHQSEPKKLGTKGAQ